MIYLGRTTAFDCVKNVKYQHLTPVVWTVWWCFVTCQSSRKRKREKSCKLTSQTQTANTSGKLWFSVVDALNGRCVCTRNRSRNTGVKKKMLKKRQKKKHDRVHGATQNGRLSSMLFYVWIVSHKDRLGEYAFRRRQMIG